MDNKTLNAIVIQEIINYINKQECKYTIDCKDAFNTAYNLYNLYKSNYDLNTADMDSIIKQLDNISELM